jgi:hypothetical protein
MAHKLARKLAVFVAFGLGLYGCSSGSSPQVTATGGHSGGLGGAGGSAPPPTAANDTNPSNPNVTTTPPASPNAPLGNADGGPLANTPDAGPSVTDAGPDAPVKSWPTTDCVGGPCAAPRVCVDLDFLFVACVPCGGFNQVCCPPYAPSDPFLGTCDPGMVCASNPNFQTSPPFDLVRDVCYVPGMPPPSNDGGFNNQREMQQ